MDDLDHALRLRAFQFLTEQTSIHGEVLPWHVLSEGFLWDDRRVPLIGPQGIFKPGVLRELPLTIATAPAREGDAPPYSDGLDDNGLLNYRYRGTDPNHRDNVGLREAMRRKVPLIYLFGVVKGQYMPAWPVYVVGDDPSDLCFKVAIDEQRLGLAEPFGLPDRVAEARRSYVTVLTIRRLHQETFRQRVLRAYRENCAICHLRHAELLEAAHILPDGHPRGEPVVPNGVALCTLHHTCASPKPHPRLSDNRSPPLVVTKDVTCSRHRQGIFSSNLTDGVLARHRGRSRGADRRALRCRGSETRSRQ